MMLHSSLCLSSHSILLSVSVYKFPYFYKDNSLWVRVQPNPVWPHLALMITSAKTLLPKSLVFSVSWKNTKRALPRLIRRLPIILNTLYFRGTLFNLMCLERVRKMEIYLFQNVCKNETPLCVFDTYFHANLELQISPIPFMGNSYQIT